MTQILDRATVNSEESLSESDFEVESEASGPYFVNPIAIHQTKPSNGTSPSSIYNFLVKDIVEGCENENQHYSVINNEMTTGPYNNANSPINNHPTQKVSQNVSSLTHQRPAVSQTNHGTQSADVYQNQYYITGIPSHGPPRIFEPNSPAPPHTGSIGEHYQPACPKNVSINRGIIPTRCAPSPSIGPRHSPCVGNYTETVLSSYSFKLPVDRNVINDASKNFSFPQLVTMDISPDTLYMLHPCRQSNKNAVKHAVGAFMKALPQKTLYTLKLISSSSSAEDVIFSDLQIAVLHCIFIVQPQLRNTFQQCGIERPITGPSVDVPNSSPYNATSSYHAIQFRSLISKVTYIPIPEHLFDDHTYTFAHQKNAVNDLQAFVEQYNSHSAIDGNITFSRSAGNGKNINWSLFLGQTTYRTTPSVLYYIFNIVCKIQILEVEVMKRQPCAFFYAYVRSEDEVKQSINKLHKKILFDIHGVWFAQNDEEVEQLDQFVRSEREKIFPALPLPKQCLVVERRNSLAGPQHGRYAPDYLKASQLQTPHNVHLPLIPPPSENNYSNVNKIQDNYTIKAYPSVPAPQMQPIDYGVPYLPYNSGHILPQNSTACYPGVNFSYYDPSNSYGINSGMQPYLSRVSNFPPSFQQVSMHETASLMKTEQPHTASHTGLSALAMPMVSDMKKNKPMQPLLEQSTVTYPASQDRVMKENKPHLTLCVKVINTMSPDELSTFD